MDANNRAVPSVGVDKGALSPLADGFGGTAAVLKNCCPVETIPRVRGRALPPIMDSKQTVPVRVYGSTGQDGKAAHGSSGEFACQDSSCEFKTSSPRGLSEHYARGGHK